MPDGRQREQAILILITAILLIVIVLLLRFAVVIGDSRTAGLFKVFVIVMLGLVAICVYQFVNVP